MTTTDMPTDQPRRLTRSRDDRMVAGVCSGAAHYWDIDPVIPRVVVAALAVFGGAGFVLYALGWLLIPGAGSPSTRLERWLEGKSGDRGRDLMIVVLVLFALGFVVDSDPFAHRVSLAALVIVIAFTVAAVAGRRRADRSGHPWQRAPEPATFTTAPFGTTTTPYGPPPAADPTVAWTAPLPPPRRPRSWLGWATIGVTMLVAGVFSIVAAAGWAHPQPADVLAACVAVLGVGLLVGTVYGRAWSLIPVGLLLIGALAVANALPRNLTWTAGNREWAPVAYAKPGGYALGTGDARLDLTNLDMSRSSSNGAEARVGAGRLVVIVPTDVTVVVHASVSAGRIEMFGREQAGTSVEVDRTLPGPAVKHPKTLTVDIEMGFGNVEVEHAAT
ncbi:MAG: PspC domain-containing protein [Frankiaceae bacterium]|nr:PspC domain-containing protein [Frankiaceae bacterium]